MIQNGVQVGIVSFGDGCGIANSSGIYTRVSSFADWIQNGICQLSSSSPPACAPTLAPTFGSSVFQNASTLEPIIAPRPLSNATLSPTLALTLVPPSPEPTGLPSQEPSNGPTLLPTDKTPETLLGEESPSSASSIRLTLLVAGCATSIFLI